MFCKLYARSFWRVYGNTEEWPPSNLYWRCPKNQMVMLPCRFLAIFMQVCFGMYWQLVQISRTTFIGWQKRFLRSLCMVVCKAFFRAILPGKCFVSFIQGHFGEYMATLRPAERGGRRGKIPRVQWLLRDKRGHLRRYLGGGNTIIWGAKTK